MKPGSIVRCRHREWVLLPAESEEVWVLRPLTGTTEEVVKVHKRLSELIAYELPFERVEPALFPLPTAERVSDAASAHLLWQAARLMLREGAAPLRSLGRISIRPRVYQFVPLLMALRLDPVRLFIADDVGVGKTIEALLIARELWDRGEIRRFAVLCPPYLCDQWAQEIAQKFNLEPVVIRSGTVAQLERQVPPGTSIYEHFPVQVASIDFIKTERNRHQFLQFCPELVIVDEVHGAAAAPGGSQQERHALLQEVAKDQRRHLILLTATPHSGVEDAFRSLLALLNPDFATWNLSELSEAQRALLARHFIQRTRADILSGWETTVPFPKREAVDYTYQLSERYRQLFEQAYEFCWEIVRTGHHLRESQRRVRYWGALALLRCVMSSPAAAVAALHNRLSGVRRPLTDEGGEAIDGTRHIVEPSQEAPDDEVPSALLEAADRDLPTQEQRRLQKIATLAEQIKGTSDDTKLHRASSLIQTLLQEGFHPIVWCRYVATAEYLTEHLREVLAPEVQVLCLTGRVSDEERQTRIQAIDPELPRVLVATDCLSEGINLQEKFTAVLHYDLPWNPNRLEQREGRVDRYGQSAEKVKVVRFFGRDNPVDGVVIEVLLDKAQQIHRTLGTYVPVPEEGESVLQAIVQALFFRKGYGKPMQLTLDLGMPEVEKLHRRWERDVERERLNRSRFAQRAIKPAEVQRELEATDAVLGDPAAVQTFVLTAAQRLGIPITADPKRPKLWRVSLDAQSLATVPEAIRLALPSPHPKASRFWLISFDSPAPEGAEYVGRNHRFVAALARFLFEEALTQPLTARAARTGAIRTRAVSELTTLFLLRVRYLLEEPQKPSLLSEEVLVLGMHETSEGPRWLEPTVALRLLAEAQPDANLPLSEKRELIERALEKLNPWAGTPDEEAWGLHHPWQKGIREQIYHRAAALLESHKRLRQALALRKQGLRLKPHLPPDLLGILILQPLVEV